MNEPTPERQLFRPPREDIDITARLLRLLLETANVEPPSERLVVPSMFQQRSWSANGAYFSATFVMDTSGLTDSFTHMKLMRANQSQDIDDFFEVRTYRYVPTTGEMQVINSLFTLEELMTTRYGSDEAKLHQDGIDEGLTIQLFTADKADYTDFLADISSFEGPL